MEKVDDNQVDRQLSLFVASGDRKQFLQEQAERRGSNADKISISRYLAHSGLTS